MGYIGKKIKKSNQFEKYTYLCCVNVMKMTFV